MSKQSDPQAKKAELSYQVLEVKIEAENVSGAGVQETAALNAAVLPEGAALSLLNVKLFTGRHHQIRVQLSHHLAGIWGDMKYNSQSRNMSQEIALYSWRLSFLHPKTKKPMQFEKRPEKYPFSEFETIREKQC